MKETMIERVNGVEIVTVERDGEVYVPIKPICDALGIDAKTQRDKIQEDEFFSSTGGIIPSVAADGKERDMFCIRLRDVYGWLATINPGKVSAEAQEAVKTYRRLCYDVLYDHFAGSASRAMETNLAEIELLETISAAMGEAREARSRRKKAEADLEQLRADRLNPQPRLL